MPSLQRGLRPAVAGGVLAALFLFSVGVSAAASVALTPHEPDVVASGETSGPSTSPTDQTDTTSQQEEQEEETSSSSSPERTIQPVSDAPIKATKSDVKKAEKSLCNAIPDSLPTIDFGTTAREWTKTLEVLAADRGFAPGPIDGIYTVQTRNAIRSFESTYGSSVDGGMEGDTWQALWDDLCTPDEIYVVTDPGWSDSSGDGDGGDGDDGGLTRLPE